MYLNGNVLLMEEHPAAQQMAEVAKLGGVDMGDLGKTMNIYKKFGIDDWTPIQRQDLFKKDLVLIHVEENNFMVYKSHRNPFKEGDMVYLLNIEIKEWKDQL